MNTSSEGEAALEPGADPSREVLEVIAHDLRNPLMCIEGYAQILLDGNLDERSRRALSAMLSSSRYALGLVANLGDLGAAERGFLSVQPAACDAGQIAADVVESSRALTRAKGVLLELRDHSGGRRAWCDPLRLRQVVTNLVTNALAHVPRPGGLIRVVVETVAGEVAIRVEDNGRGIAPEHLQRLFDKFFQAGEGRGSLGLGLYISREILRRHGGRIWAESPGLGLGATFQVRLPAFRAGAAGTQPPSRGIAKRFLAESIRAAGIPMGRVAVLAALALFFLLRALSDSSSLHRARPGESLRDAVASESSGKQPAAER